jgi:hypothetical protein
MQSMDSEHRDTSLTDKKSQNVEQQPYKAYKHSIEPTSPA